MIQLAESTYYGKRMPKEKFYAHLETPPAVRRSFIDDIDYIVWRNKLAASTLNIAAGEKVKEIAFFEVHLKREEYNPALFEFIDRNVSVYVVYLLVFQGKAQLRVNYKEPIAQRAGSFKIIESFESCWTDEGDIDLHIGGLNLDVIYEGFVRQIAGSALQSVRGEDIVTDITAQQQRAKIEREIAQLENRMRKEKQFNRQLEMATEIRELKKFC